VGQIDVVPTLFVDEEAGRGAADTNLEKAVLMVLEDLESSVLAAPQCRAHRVDS
jgi:hypothetical protein